jgi:hypothetical protein
VELSAAAFLVFLTTATGTWVVSADLGVLSRLSTFGCIFQEQANRVI